MDTFEERFSDENSLDQSVQASFRNYGSFMAQGATLLKEMEKKLFTEASTISRNVRTLAETYKLFTFQCVAAAGLKRFAPDVLGDPESMYNLIHERVAIHTFSVIAAAGGYSFMQCNIALVRNDPAIVTLMYRNFVFSHLRELIRRETGRPGRVEEDYQRTASTKRRERVSNTKQNAPDVDADFL